MTNNLQITAAERDYDIKKQKDTPISTYFGNNTFNHKAMKEKLPEKVYDKLMQIINENKDLDLETANSVAHGMKEWAIENGATHFAHWFQPMTGATAEKHDAFIEPIDACSVIERFSGKQLIQGEPDASSFPSGGIRVTFEARGYTAWDMSSTAFIRKNGLGRTLCIPTAFISYTGEALDKKTPLLRSVRAINASSTKMLKLLKNKTSKKVIANIGAEQEYFLIDSDYYNKRQDLVLTGRTLIGAPPAKGQELDDQYFGNIHERVQSFMHDSEEELFLLGIPAKTRHNEVAPGQYELAPIYEEANIAIDHNQLIMDTLQSVAKNHKLACLFHEKPFARINGSGKHLNWSLSTDDGINLFSPGKNPEENLPFLMFLTAAIKGVHKHADILRASVGSSGNDHRLGANEAPPAIISIFLGEQLTQILENIENNTVTGADKKSTIDLNISSVPVLMKDKTDRNRTSPFAFTGNKFEFRAVGSSHSIAFSTTILNVIMTESLDALYLELEKKDTSNMTKAVYEVIQDELKKSKSILFLGDNYSEEWHEEAEKRGLPNFKTTPEALKSLITKKSIQLFSKYEVYSEVEITARYNVRLENYSTALDIETKSLYDIVMTKVLPASIRYQSELAESIAKTESVLGNFDLTDQKNHLKSISDLINKIQKGLVDLKLNYEKGENIEDNQETADFYCNTVIEKMNRVRKYSDVLETLVDDALWSLPKFWEMLFIK
jgi:glutamine synthetase